MGSALSERPRWFAAVLITIASIVLAHYAQVWTVVPGSLAPTSDFAGTYVASTLIRSGDAAEIYDVGAERADAGRERRAGEPRRHPLREPPCRRGRGAALDPAQRRCRVARLVAAPAGADGALRSLLVARAAPWPASLPRLPRLAIVLVALAGFGTGLLFVEGQWDGVSVLGLAAAYVLWRRERPAAAGFALGFTAAIAKPQLVIGVAAYMIGRRDWRAVGGALAGAAVSVVIGLIGAGPHALTSFITAIATPSNSPTAQMQGTSGLFGSLLGHAPGVFLLAVAAGIGAAAVAGWLGTVAHRRPDLFEPSLCGAVALSLFASPHLLGHDLTLLAPVLVAGLAWLAGRPGERPWPGLGDAWECLRSGCCSPLPASPICRRTASASRAERHRGCCCSSRLPGARWWRAPP